MGLPVPKLDDREFRDLVTEAITRIQRRSPQWTDFNPSDPGMALVDVMAWMTETILYRLNRVSERNYIKFLELMGVRLKPAEAARAWVQFTLANPVARIPRGTKLSTKKQEGQDAIPFETCADLIPTMARLVNVHSVEGERDADHTARLEGVARAVAPSSGEQARPKALPREPIFKGLHVAPHALVLKDSRLDFGDAALQPKLQLHIGIELHDALSGATNVEWDARENAADGMQWAPIAPGQDATDGLRKSGEVVFDTLACAQPDQAKQYAFRMRLVGPPPDVLPTLLGIRRRVALNPAHRLLPERAYRCSEIRLPADVAEQVGQDAPRVAYTELELTREFFPFGARSQIGNSLYLRSAVFGRPGTTVRIDAKMSPRFEPAIASTLMNEGLELLWEYYSTTGRWIQLGRSTAAPVVQREYEFTDDTAAFTRSGVISFVMPWDVGPLALQGEMGSYVRVTIVGGSYGNEEKRAPCISEMSLAFEDPFEPWGAVSRDNYGTYDDVTVALSTRVPTAPFVIEPQRDPALYLGFDAALPNELQRIYFALADDLGAVLRPRATPTQRKQPATATFRWEYSRGDGWVPLDRVSDGTKAFSRSNAVTFIGPKDWAVAPRYHAPAVSTVTGQESPPAFWLRARFVNGERLRPPYLRGVYLNAVEAEQLRTIESEILGSSTGEPLQTFRLTKVPILPHPEILVREQEMYRADELEQLRKEVEADRVLVESVKNWDDRGETHTATPAWVAWREVDTFYSSDKDDRHFVVDHTLGTVTFGDGRKGAIPPLGPQNIKAKSYRQCEGAKGNVGRDTIIVLETNLNGVQRVTNVEEAEGGADAETIEAAKQRGPSTIQNHDRAVTVGDFESLALEASGQVARAHCIQEDDDIVVVVIPDSKGDKPHPASRLIDRVLDYLDARRLITTRVKVVPPEYEDIRLSIEVSVKKQFIAQFPDVALKIKRRLREFVHPLLGDDSGDGWTMGRSLHLSELYYVIERFDEVDVCDSLKMWRWTDSEHPTPHHVESLETLPPDVELYGPSEARIGIGARAFPYFRDIQIVQG